ncbi:dienelactone hydrolase family protein [Paenibacillus sp. FA6]|uniref:dienelactone hydrolase family protein n=1 Tax=Paenibacillus sp. FA6 TaxID=3413029 RepID=UPI003F65948B
MWNADLLLEQLYDEAMNQHKAGTESETPLERKIRLKQLLQQLNGSFEPNREHVPVLLERTICDGYVRERVELSATPGLTFGAYVLIPEGAHANTPAVLAIHGHGYGGSREIIGLNPDGTPKEGEAGIHQYFAVELVKRGMIVIAPDVVGFAERRLLSDLKKDPNIENSCHRISVGLLMVGKTLTGLRVSEAQAALQYIIARPEVNPQAIGVMGFSGGSLIASVLAALDDRVKATVLIGFPNTFRDSILNVRHCIDNYTPGIMNYAERPEWIGLIAPRHLFVESGDKDHIFPAVGFEQTVQELKEIYTSEGVEERLESDLFPGGHEVSGRRSYDWMRRVLDNM